jgi:hypothetical protein
MDELNSMLSDDKVTAMLSSVKLFLLSDKDTIDADEESDVEASNLDDSEEETDCDIDTAAESEVGRAMRRAWSRRRQSLVHSYSVAGWMLSPVEEIMEDAKANHSGDHILLVENLLVKLFPHDTQENKNMMINTFWDEHTQFHSKLGPYANRDHIWKSTDLENNQSHIWHMKNSLKFTEWLGRFACRVCSKILGIGSAERAWGDVKKIKTDRRAHLSAGATQMQATIYGRHCSEKAKFRRLGKEESSEPFWEEDDFDHLGLGRYGLERPDLDGTRKTKRIFRAWFEDWEKEIYEKCDPVHQKLVEKYGGLSWRDLDDPQTIFTADTHDMYFCRSRKKGEKGYQIIGYESDYHADENHDAYDHWNLPDNDDGDCAAVYDCIIDYYENNPDQYISVIRKEEENGENEASNVDVDSDDSD